jgi:hypothetical protein
MALWVGSAWVVACLAAMVIMKRRERGFLVVGFVIAAIAMAIAVERSIGLTQRPADTGSAEFVELRNHSSATLHVVAADDDGRDALIATVRGGRRTFLRADRQDDGRFCLRGVTEAIILRPGASLRDEGTRLVGADDRSVNFTLIDCHDRGLTVVTWDGSEAYTDIDGKPYLLDSRRSRVLAGFGVGAVALAGAWRFDREPIGPRRQRGGARRLSVPQR